MNISLLTQTSYSPYLPANRSECGSDLMEREQEKSHDNLTLSKHMRQLLRGLKNTREQDRNPYTSVSKDRENGFLELSGSSESEETEITEKPVNYDYKEVAAKIQQAKTSIRAGQAVISAKRKVLEIKRKIASEDGDAVELQLALTHAKRMEMVARKKKHHLELEEMVVNTQRRDENRDEMEEAASDMKNALIDAEEEKVTEQEDDIFYEREEMITEAYEEAVESGSKISEDMLSKLNKMISEFGEEELKQLEEAREMLENMEIEDPHMSKEDLDDLKRKHRAAENKAIVKADMEYLKKLIKYQQEKAGNISEMSGSGSSSGSISGISGSGSSFESILIPDSIGADVSLSGLSLSEGGAIDIQV